MHIITITLVKIPWTEEPGGLQSMVSQRVGNDCVYVQAHTHTHTHILYIL